MTDRNGLNGGALRRLVQEYEALDKDRQEAQTDQRELLAEVCKANGFDKGLVRWLIKELRQDKAATAAEAASRQAYMDAYLSFDSTALGQAAAERGEATTSEAEEGEGKIRVEGEGELGDAVKAAAREAGVLVEVPASTEPEPKTRAQRALRKSRLSLAAG
jgi:uncharacterized protein (UPF0335 family)